MADLTLFTGSSNRSLAAAIAAELGARLGASSVTRFPDGEIAVRLEEPVRGHDVFLVQPTAPPVNDHLMEPLALADACRRSAAGWITAVVPYFGYARSDKRHGRREPITASLVARLMQAAGIDHVLTLDLHVAQIERFFQIPVDRLTAVPVLTCARRGRLAPEVVIVSPDAGHVKTAVDFAQRLDTSVVLIHKRRTSGTETQVTHVVEEVAGRSCLIIDDMIATGGTIVRAVDALLAAGARSEITVAATHGLFIGDAHRLLNHDAIWAVVGTDSVAAAEPPWPVREVVSVAPLFAAAILRVRSGGSLGDLY